MLHNMTQGVLVARNQLADHLAVRLLNRDVDRLVAEHREPLGAEEMPPSSPMFRPTAGVPSSITTTLAGRRSRGRPRLIQLRGLDLASTVGPAILWPFRCRIGSTASSRRGSTNLVECQLVASRPVSASPSSTMQHVPTRRGTPPGTSTRPDQFCGVSVHSMPAWWLWAMLTNRRLRRVVSPRLGPGTGARAAPPPAGCLGSGGSRAPRRCRAVASSPSIRSFSTSQSGKLNRLSFSTRRPSMIVISRL
ncbi:MAG: hypothetical protein V7646_5846 [Pseudonocardia sp.]